MKLSCLLITCLYLGLTLASSTEDDSITRNIRSANPAARNGRKFSLASLFQGMFGKSSNNVARRHQKPVPLVRRPPHAKNVLLPHRKPLLHQIIPQRQVRPNRKPHPSPPRYKPQPAATPYKKAPIPKPTPPPVSGKIQPQRYELDSHSRAPPALPPVYSSDSVDYFDDNEASTIGFDYEVVTTPSPAVESNEAIYSYPTPQPLKAVQGSSSKLALGTSNNINNANQFSPPQPHEIIMISTLTNAGAPLTAEVSNSFSFSGASGSPTGVVRQEQLNSFSSDEDLVKNGFNSLPSLREIKSTMDASISQIDNSIDDGFADIKTDFADQDIKKITFSTMEISQMDNGTITKFFPSKTTTTKLTPIFNKIPSTPKASPPPPQKPPKRTTLIFPGHKLAKPVAPTQQPKLTVTVKKDFFPSQKEDVEIFRRTVGSKNPSNFINSIQTKSTPKTLITPAALKTIFSGDAKSEQISQFLYEAFISEGYEDLLDDKIDEIKAEAMKLEEAYWGNKEQDFSLEL